MKQRDENVKLLKGRDSLVTEKKTSQRNRSSRTKQNNPNQKEKNDLH